MKVARQKGKRTVKYTRTKPPLTYSCFDNIPRTLNHRIRGDIEVTYTPILADDLRTGITHVLEEDEGEIQLEDPGGPRVESRIIKDEDVKEFLEQHANGELAEKGMPSVESVAIYPNVNERLQKGLELGAVARKQTEDENEETPGIFDEKTKTFEDVLDEATDFWNLNDPLDYEYDEPKKEIKPTITCNIKLPKIQQGRGGQNAAKKEAKIRPHRYLDTPKTEGNSKNTHRNVKRSTPKTNRSKVYFFYHLPLKYVLPSQPFLAESDWATLFAGMAKQESCNLTCAN